MTLRETYLCLSSDSIDYTPFLAFRRNPKNRKALQKIFSNTKPKLLGFIAKVRS